MSSTIRTSVSRVVRASIAAACVPALWTIAAPAQAEGLAATSASGGLEEIVVTANKRSENMQTVPIAITAITADSAARIGVVNAQSLAMVVPGLRLDRQTNGTIPFLRGVGNPSSQVAAEAAVAVYVDDVYMSSTQANLTNYNSIDRLEVRKEPQSRWSGRHATGGVIQVFTKNPTPEKQFDLELGYANYQTVNGNLYATGELMDGLSGNIALYKKEQNDGWGTNFTTGNETYIEENTGGRAKLLWDADDKTSVLLSVDFDNYNNGQGMYFRPVDGTMSNAGASSIPPKGDYDTKEFLDPTGKANQYGGSGKIRHDFGFMSVVSITAWRSGHAEQHFDQDGSYLFRLFPHLYYSTETFTQEIQFLSSDESRIKWTGGFFYMNDHADLDKFQFTGLLAGGSNAARGGASENRLKSYSGFFQGTLPIGDRLNITAGIRRTTDKRDMAARRINRTTADIYTPAQEAANSGINDKWSSWSGKFSIDYQFTDSIMGYIAYNRGFKGGTFNAIPALDAVNPLVVPAGQPNAGAPNQPGCRYTGGVKTCVPFNIDAPVEPEKIDAYTAGFKSQFWDDKIRFNGEAFFYSYSGLQLQKVSPLPGGINVTIITNAAKAEMKGFDFDLTVLPADGWTVSWGAQIMDGEYKKFPNGSFFVYRPTGGNCSVVPTPGHSNCAINPPNYDPATGGWDLKGNDTIYTPHFSSTLTVSYLWQSPIGDIDFTGNYAHTAKYFADADNGLGQIAPSSPDNDRQDALDLFNGSVTWYSPDEKYDVRIWGKNLSDKRYWSFANETTTITKNVPAPPRTYGITFMAHF